MYSTIVNIQYRRFDESCYITLYNITDFIQDSVAVHIIHQYSFKYLSKIIFVITTTTINLYLGCLNVKHLAHSKPELIGL
jgi:hypothetical protein